jgi:hypothetical protein
MRYLAGLMSHENQGRERAECQMAAILAPHVAGYDPGVAVF